MSNEKRLSVIVVTRNEARYVARLHEAVQKIQKPDTVKVETVLVDGGSTDGTADTARQAGFTKVIVCPDANIPVCRNRGVREASGDWIAFLDGDCEPAEDWLEQARPFLESPEKVVLGWPAEPPSPRTWVQTAWLYHWTHKNPRIENYRGRRVVRREGFRLVTTRNMILHRDVFDDLEGFNEALPTGEDTDFAFRAYMAGITVLGVPELKVIHHGEPATLRAFFRQQLWHANRRSYEHIMKLSGGRVGGNAPRYTWIFAMSLALALCGLGLSLVFRTPGFAIFVTPLILVVVLPALAISGAGGRMAMFPALCVIYFIYGLARTVDLLGLARNKVSWKLEGKAPAEPRA